MSYYMKYNPRTNLRMKPYVNKHAGWAQSLFAWEQSRGEIQIKAPKDTVGVYTTFVTPQGKFTGKMVMGERMMRTRFQRWTEKQKPTYYEERALASLPLGSIPPPLPAHIAAKFKKQAFPGNPRFPDITKYQGAYYQPQSLMEMGNPTTIQAEVHSPFNMGPKEGYYIDSPIVVEDWDDDDASSVRSGPMELTTTEEPPEQQMEEERIPDPPPRQESVSSLPKAATTSETPILDRQMEILQQILDRLDTQREGQIIFSSLTAKKPSSAAASSSQPEGEEEVINPEEEEEELINLREEEEEEEVPELVRIEDTESESEAAQEKPSSQRVLKKKRPVARVIPFRRTPTPGPTAEDRRIAALPEPGYESESPSYPPASYSPVYSPSSPVYSPSSPVYQPTSPVHFLPSPEYPSPQSPTPNQATPLIDPWEEILSEN